ncbi:NADP-dependent 3-hydroxy acid dehydrogenase YdfG [Kribbella orskensis]|uniref:NADP-dependent 3-hydroxy acid dehydrogenase YdfG n=1 Tax=Kribbella orskensis TaxID=2512216 RepID=A0ABY2BI49_9ACTN|nr:MULTISPECIES: SDR family NAD(P)-dependent oxidoreductase [Kribbella]TCN37636.1 NADP-dependent 3-hydroxy acid dehydrogenase YdfG [Kribbella sp. VKM Ac-2500]TCO18862.1 NADP-dependent 3-hydroxy acid dehydrogenase YdfG [Kribbella orskensis]
MSNEGQDRVWLITGCSTGFGRELVLAALAAGDRVMATARRPETLADLAELGKGRVSTAALDVTDPASVEAAVQATLAVFGRIDVLVNNAGSLVMGALEEVGMKRLREQYDVVFFGAAEVTSAVVPVLREQGHGTIVQMSSLGGLKTYPGYGAYNSAKWALEGYSEVLAAELAPLGIRVLIVEPGAFRTEFNRNKVTTPELSAYKESAGLTRQATAALLDSEENDPVKGVAAIMKALDSDNPPLRLLLGNDAVDGLREHHDALLAEVTEWEELSRSTAIS